MIRGTSARADTKRRLRTGAGLVAALSAIVLVATPAFAGSAGDLDRSFGDHGRLVIKRAHGFSQSVAVGGHGRIVVVGGGDDVMTVARLRPDGGLDPSFANNGLAILRFDDTQGASLNSIAVGRRGGVVTAGEICPGYHDCHMLIVRFRRDGELDPSFGEDGQVELTYSRPVEGATSVAIVGGRIAVAGLACHLIRGPEDCEVTVARLQPNGALDESFGGGGKVVLPCEAPYVRAVVGGGSPSLAIDSRQQIVVGGTCADAPVFFARLKPDGQLDRSFGNDGTVAKDARITTLNAMTLDSHDRIYAAGNLRRAFAVARFGAKGKLDTSFGKHGRAVAKFSSVRVPQTRSVGIDSRRRVVVTGIAGGRGFAFARFTSRGRADRSFGHRGRVVAGRKARFSGGGKGPFVSRGDGAIDSRDRVIAAGGTGWGWGLSHRFALVRLLGR